MHRARTVEEYVDLVKQALFEVQDLRNCLEYYLEEEGRYPLFLDPLEKGIRELHQSMVDGTYIFANGDLPFMELVNKHALEIPFTELLECINETHLRGLDVVQT